MDKVDLIKEAFVHISEKIVYMNMGKNFEFTFTSTGFNIEGNFININLRLLTSESKPVRFNSYMVFPNPNIDSESTYYGGLGLIFLPTYQDKVPCVRKVVLASEGFDIKSTNGIDYMMLNHVLPIQKGNLCTISLDEDQKVRQYITAGTNRKLYYKEYFDT